MNWFQKSPITRTLRLLVLLSLLALLLPQAASAAPLRAITVNFVVLSVKVDESVTIRTADFPVRTNFTVIMGKATNKAVGGEVSTEFNSGAGGKQIFTFPIPEKIKGTGIIGIRIESKDGYQAYAWFFNQTQTLIVPDANLKPELTFSDVTQNTTVTVEATNLPPLTLFRVRVGPHYTFYQNYLSVADVTTDEKGIARFTVKLEKNVKDAEFIGVRLDGASKYVYAAFSNKNGGTVVPPAQLIKIVPCTLLYINPIPDLGPREDFDVVWTMQNTELVDWDMGRYLFKYRGGEAMHKDDEKVHLNGDKVFLKYTVQRGWTYDLAVDMLAPETPGWHSTTWALVNRFDETICTFKVFVHVKQR
jgi:hypothetical protein